jgi:hypothetical protein
VGETNVVASGVLPHLMTDPDWKSAPLTVSVKFGSPLLTALGLSENTSGVGAVTTNGAAPETPYFGSATVTLAVPAVFRYDAGMVALRDAALTKVVGSVAPFQRITEALVKFAPVTERVSPCAEPVMFATAKPEEFAGAVLGARAPIFGVGGAKIWNVSGLDGVLDPVFVSVIVAEPAVVIMSAEITAVSMLDETNVVASGVPFQLMAAPFRHFAPVTVSVNDAPPAVADAGARLLIVGVPILTVNVRAAVATVLPLMTVPTVIGTVVGVQI